MTQQNGEGVVSQIEGHQAGRDPGGNHQRNPALRCKQVQEESGADLECAELPAHDERSRQRIVGEINAHHEDDDRAHGQHEQPTVIRDDHASASAYRTTTTTRDQSGVRAPV